MNFFKLNQPLFEKDGGAGGDEDDETTDDGTGGDNTDNAGKKKKVEFDPEQQKEINRIVADRLARQEAQIKADTEAKEKKAKEDAEKKALEEQGKFKELAEAEQKKAQEAEDRANNAIAEASRLKLQREFEQTVSAMDLKFVSPKAAEDAFTNLDVEAVGEDYKGMKDAVEKLIEDREYLFEEVPTTGQNIDATNKGKISKTVAKKSIVDSKRKKYSKL
jgi:hypothetical protein